MKKLTYTKPLTVTNKKNLDVFGEELEKWFGTKAVYGFYKMAAKKVGMARVKRAFDLMEKTGDKEWTHFTQNVWHG